MASSVYDNNGNYNTIFSNRTTKKTIYEKNFFAISIFSWQWNRFLIYGRTWNDSFYSMKPMVAEITEMMANPNAAPETKKTNLLSELIFSRVLLKYKTKVSTATR